MIPPFYMHRVIKLGQGITDQILEAVNTIKKSIREKGPNFQILSLNQSYHNHTTGYLTS